MTRTLFLAPCPFVPRWAWVQGDAQVLDEVPSDRLLTTGFDLALISPKPSATYVAKISRLDGPLNAAWLDLGGGHSAMMPLKSRQLSANQLLRVQITRPAGQHKGARAQFLEPAPKGSKLGLYGPWTIGPVLEQADAIVVSDPTWTAPSGGMARIAADPSVQQSLQALCHPSPMVQVQLPGGGSAQLLVEQGETLTAIDLNGPPGELSNRALAPHVARQIVRRNLGGLIIVDLIGAPPRAQRQGFVDLVRDELDRLNRALPPTLANTSINLGSVDHHGLMVIERQRAAPSQFELEQSLGGRALQVGEHLGAYLRAKAGNPTQGLDLGADDVTWLRADPHRLLMCQKAGIPLS